MPVVPFETLYDHVAKLQGRTAIKYSDAVAKRGTIDPNDDVRITTLGKLNSAMTNANVGLAMVVKYLQYDNWWNVHQPDLKGTARQAVLDEFVNMLRRSLFQDCFLAVESSLRVILKSLAPTAAEGSTGDFKAVYECLLKSHLSKKYTSECELLDLLRLVRNTMHNNGVYQPKSGRAELISWKGTTYQFTPGVAVTMVDWHFVVDRLDELVALCNSVMSDPVVAGIAHQLKDPAVTQVPRAHKL